MEPLVRCEMANVFCLRINQYLLLVYYSSGVDLSSHLKMLSLVGLNKTFSSATRNMKQKRVPSILQACNVNIRVPNSEANAARGSGSCSPHSAQLRPPLPACSPSLLSTPRKHAPLESDTEI